MRPSGEEEGGCGAGVEPATSPSVAVTMEQRPVAGRRSPIAFGALPLSYPQHEGTGKGVAQGDIVKSDNPGQSARPQGKRPAPPKRFAPGRGRTGYRSGRR